MGYSTPFAIPITLIPLRRRRRKLDEGGAASEVLGRRLSNICLNYCADAGDDDCDDGGAGSEYDSCDLGSDCDDCGVRTSTDSPTAAPTEAPTPAIDACYDHHPDMTTAGVGAWVDKVYELPKGIFEARIAYVGFPTATDYSPLVTEVTQKLNHRT